MQTILDIFGWIFGNLPTVFTMLAALHGVALIVVNVTPTPNDNRILGKVYKVIEMLAGILTPTAKEFPGEREG